MSTLLSVSCLSKRFSDGALPVVNGLSFEVEEGETFALLGPSGCGKTTALRCIAGFEAPDSGTVTLGGRPLVSDDVSVPPEQRGIGFVFQDYALFPHLSVRDNVAFGLKGLPKKQRAERTAEVIRLVGLAGFEERRPHALSGGQQQRVALARALAPAPRLLLLDEPFSNLDTPLKIVLQKELARLLEASGVPTLLVVHEVEDIVALADRVVVMREGRIVREGTPVGLHTNPGDAYVAGFFARLRIPGCVPAGPFLDEASGAP